MALFQHSPCRLERSVHKKWGVSTETPINTNHGSCQLITSGTQRETQENAESVKEKGLSRDGQRNVPPRAGAIETAKRAITGCVHTVAATATTSGCGSSACKPPPSLGGSCASR
eukprot:5261747-Amphidinium_carterae.1